MILPQTKYISCSIKAEPKALPYIGVLFHHVHHVHHVHVLLKIYYGIFQISVNYVKSLKFDIVESTSSLYM